ncbi:helix-turn-helix domain-containing protein [Banduia mediterranea]|uniref:helix-turn-helix domain-containing protein n=1 Tax=Banduia mediterranea TaxID=3075609 RepID=UPI003D778CF1
MNLAGDVHGETTSYRHESGDAGPSGGGESNQLGGVSLRASGAAAGAVGRHAGTDGRSAGRRRELLSLEGGRHFLAPWAEDCRAGGVLVVSPIRAALAQKLGRPVAASVVYRLLARHGWRRVAPDTRHPKSDPKVQEDWKKTARNSGGLPETRMRPNSIPRNMAGMNCARRSFPIGSLPISTASSANSKPDFRV